MTMVKTEWEWCALAVCIDEAVGAAMASAIAFQPGDEETFAKGTPVVRAGVPGKFAVLPLKSTGFAAITEFLGDGPHPTWNARGIPDETLAQYRLAFPSAVVGEARAVRASAAGWLASEGWAVVPE